MPILFHTDLVTNEDLDNYTQEFNALVNQQLLPGRKLEKLTGPSRPTYSMRINDEIRIIFTYFTYKGERHPLFIGVANQHNYEDYLKKEYYSDFLQKHEDEFKLIIDEFEEVNARAALPEVTLERRKTHIIGRKAIVLEGNQLNVKAPALVEGPPGSGKTCIAYAQLENFAQAQEEGKKLLYVTRSKYLADNLLAQWKQSPHYSEAVGTQIQLYTYDQLLHKMEPNLQFKTQAWEDFLTWLKATPGIISTKLSQQIYKTRAETLYQEFRIISGYKEEKEYLEAGAKKCLYDKNQRKEIYTQYTRWKNYCADNRLNFSEFHALNEDIAQANQYDIIHVDEAQDFSHCQLENLIKLAIDQQIIYYIDPKQSLEDDISKVLYVKDTFEKNGKTLKVTQLDESYRCAPNIMRLGNEVNELRKSCTPKGKHETPLKLSNEDKGHITWLNTQDKSSLEWIKEQKDNADVCILTTEKHKNDLLAQGYSRVFTVEEFKGLQKPTVVLYQLLNDPIYYEINRTENEDPAYSKHLCKLFTAVTRAEHNVVFFQDNDPRLKDLMNRLKSIGNKATVTLVKKTRSQDEILAEARDYFARGLKDNASALLKNELKYETNKIQFTLRGWDNELNPEYTAPKAVEKASSSSKPQEDTNALKKALDTKSLILTLDIIKESDKFDKEISEVIDSPVYQKKLVSMICSSASVFNLMGLAMLVSHPKKDQIKWDNDEVISPAFGLIQKFCQYPDLKNDTPARAILTLIEDKRVNFNKPLARLKLIPSLLQSPWTRKFIINSGKVDLDTLAKVLTKSELHAFHEKLILLCTGNQSFKENEKIYTYFEENAPRMLFNLAEKFHQNKDSLSDAEQHSIELYRRAAKCGVMDAASVLSYIKSKAAIKEQNIVKKVEYLREAIEYGTKGDDVARSNIPFLQSQLHQFMTIIANDHSIPSLLQLCQNRPANYLAIAMSKIMDNTKEIHERDTQGRSAFLFACILDPTPNLIKLFMTHPEFKLSEEFEKTPARFHKLLNDNLVKFPELHNYMERNDPEFFSKFTHTVLGRKIAEEIGLKYST